MITLYKKNICAISHHYFMDFMIVEKLRSVNKSILEKFAIDREISKEFFAIDRFILCTISGKNYDRSQNFKGIFYDRSQNSL